jgi:hypothetical protein
MLLMQIVFDEILGHFPQGEAAIINEGLLT